MLYDVSMANHNDIENHDRYGMAVEYVNSSGYAHPLWCRECGVLICDKGVTAHDRLHRLLQDLAAEPGPSSSLVEDERSAAQQKLWPMP